MPPDLVLDRVAKKGSEGWWSSVYTFSFVIVYFTLLYSIHSWQFHWFARSGALMTVAGVILTGAQFIESTKRALSTSDEDEPVVKPLYKEKHSRWFGEYYGFTLIVIGTLIWGFGDLPNVIWAVKPLATNH